MLTTSGVRYQETARGWRAVLPQGTYLPEAVVIEQTEEGLSANLESPLDRSFVFPCQRRPDGLVELDMAPDQRAQVLFDPSSLYYGVRAGGHGEGFAADGTWVYDWTSRGQSYRAERSPTGELSGTSTRGGRTVPMQVRTEDRRLIIEPDRTPLRERIAEHGFFSGLKLAFDCFTSGSLNTFWFKDQWELFPNLARRAESLRAEMEAGTETVQRMARPPEAYHSVKVTQTTVSVGGVLLKKATRRDPQPGS